MLLRLYEGSSGQCGELVCQDKYFLFFSSYHIRVEVLTWMQDFFAGGVSIVWGWQLGLYLALETFVVDLVDCLLHHDAVECAIEFGLELCF